METLLLTLILFSTRLGASFATTSCSYTDLVEYLNLTDTQRFLMVRPVSNWQDPTYVEVDISLDNIVQLDGKTQRLTSIVWFEMTWKNSFISWNPDDFCGIKKMKIPLDILWMPDIYIYENIDEDLSIKVNFLEINYDGTVSQSKPWRIVTSCNMDAYGFPFDRQTCFLTFGPYVNTVEEIIVKAASNSTTVQKLTDQHYIDRGEWDLQSIEVSNQNLTFGEEVFSKVRYKLNLRRIPVLYIINLVVPACFLIILDFASMFIPINGGERLGFKITVVLGFSVLLLIMNDLLPSTSSTPLLGVFFSLSIALMVISIFATISILYMVELSSMRKSVPIFLKKWVLTYLAKILLVKHQPVGSGDAAEINNTFTNIQLANNLSETMKEQPNVDSNAQVQLWRKLLSEVTMIRQQLATIRQDEETRSEWQMVSYVVDRFTCILYFLTIVISMTAVIAVWGRG
ncbi:5-hydroxytryptamine receptor 3A-like isoform X1 [Polypterus senegalus]|uniref:5-hydroxytryptamine receptor 3A-like isoform X1 n=2 Tax=Polypterus senegalus TaxID=55291 RepID=UPI00196645C4|nr:5-hydroxytryptamine receptor 3A-like isoform X1 [Polypterus senegalus]